LSDRFTRETISVSSAFLPAPWSYKPKDLPQATWNMGDPFTNLQDGLHLAAEMLERRPSPNQQMIVITDGQPTAYCRQGRLYCEWPLSFGGISQRAAEETLKEAERINRKGITINTFMLDDSPVLRGFVDDLTRINRGRAFYTRPDRLGQYLLIDYLSHQKRRSNARALNRSNRSNSSIVSAVKFYPPFIVRGDGAETGLERLNGWNVGMVERGF
jgi:hypothetical protein